MVKYHTIRERNVGQEREQVSGDRIAVDVRLRIGLDDRWQVYLVYIHQRIGADNTIAGSQVFVRSLEVGHGECPVPELECHEAVAILVRFNFGELVMPDAPLGQDVIHLGNLRMEVQPRLRVVLHELAALRLLCHYQVRAYLRELSSLEIIEIAPGQELRIFRYVMVVGLFAEDVLLLQGIALAEGLHHIGEHILKTYVLPGIGTELLHRVGHLEDDGRIALG